MARSAVFSGELPEVRIAMAIGAFSKRSFQFPLTGWMAFCACNRCMLSGKRKRFVRYRRLFPGINRMAGCTIGAERRFVRVEMARCAIRKWEAFEYLVLMTLHAGYFCMAAQKRESTL